MDSGAEIHRGLLRLSKATRKTPNSGFVFLPEQLGAVHMQNNATDKVSRFRLGRHSQNLLLERIASPINRLVHSSFRPGGRSIIHLTQTFRTGSTTAPLP